MGGVPRMNTRLLDDVFAEYLHPVSVVFLFVVTGGVYGVIIDGPQQLPHCEFVHQRLKLILERGSLWLIARLPFPGRSGTTLG